LRPPSSQKQIDTNSSMKKSSEGKFRSPSADEESLGASS